MTAFTPKQQPFPAEIPFLHDLGVEFHGMADGRAEIALTLQPRHMNSWHVTHGGVVMTLLDVVMSMAGRSLDPEARGGVTIEMKTSFMEPGGKAGAASSPVAMPSTVPAPCASAKASSGTASGWWPSPWAHSSS